MVTIVDTNKAEQKARSQQKAQFLKEAREMLKQGKISDSDYKGYEITLKKALKNGTEMSAFIPVIKDTETFGGLNVGNAGIERSILKADEIASRVRMVAFETLNDRTVLTVTTVKFDHDAFNGKNFPVVTRFRTYTQYNDGRTTQSESMLAGRGFTTSDVNMPYIDLDNNDPLLRFTYNSVINAHKRLENARRTVKLQAETGMKMEGHDETKREKVTKFLTAFARKVVKATKQGMSSEEIEAKAKALALMLANQE